MNEAELKEKLRKEGFTHVYIWEDQPHAHHPDHTHSRITVYIVLEGEITTTSEGKTHTYKAGERFELSAGIVHSMNIGSSGCRYIIGEE
jgi:quercetin dioxygenase-like cupin family protein